MQHSHFGGVARQPPSLRLKRKTRRGPLSRIVLVVEDSIAASTRILRQSKLKPLYRIIIITIILNHAITKNFACGIERNLYLPLSCESRPESPDARIRLRSARPDIELPDERLVMQVANLNSKYNY